MKKIFYRIVDVVLLLAVWYIAFFAVWFFVLSAADSAKYTGVVMFVGVSSVIVLLVLYTRFWVIRWREMK